MRKLTRLITAMALIICADASAQITVPVETVVGHKLQAIIHVKGVPDDAVIKGEVFVDIPGCEYSHGPTPDIIDIWGPARKTPYTIDVSLVWGVKHPTDPKAWSDFGYFRDKAPFSIVGDIPPGPDPDPDPDPVIDSPIAADGLHVMIVRESGQALPKKQQALLTSTKWQTIVGPNKWRVMDPNVEFLAPSIWKDAMEATKEHGVPRLIISNRPYGGYIGQLPADTIAMVALVSEWKTFGEGGAIDE